MLCAAFVGRYYYVFLLLLFFISHFFAYYIIGVNENIINTLFYHAC